MIPKQKQTAVEWLFEQIWDTPKDKLTWYSILNQALEKEKDQIADTFDYGYFCAASGTDEEFELSGRSYYDIVYKKYGLDNDARDILNKL